jgi:hypothetical protein
LLTLDTRRRTVLFAHGIDTLATIDAKPKGGETEQQQRVPR